MNKLFYGDNLDVLRSAVADASVDLVYLDPPFNSNAGYNVLFRSASGAGADASIEAFDDTWTWGPASQGAMMDLAGGTNRALQVMMGAMHDALGDSPLMAYLAMMAVRLVELHRVLKDTGSLYLHCDPTASHYLKLVLDAVFGAANFRSEIVWRRTTSRSNTTRSFADVTDTIFYYSKGLNFVFHKQFTPYSDEYLKSKYRHTDEDGRIYRLSDLRNPGVRPNLHYEYKGFKPHPNGWAVSREKMERFDQEGRLEFPKRPDGRIQIRRYLDEREGTPVPTLWEDIRPINSQAQERLGYPTQKPRALLERIIAASSNPGDLVLDPFCGCGTAVDAAEKLGRRWIGIDITHLAIGMIADRMREGYPGIRFETIGVPRDLASAEKLAADDPHQFQQWVCWQVGGFPRDRKGGDKGVDGWFNYLGAQEGSRGGKIETGVISVKAGDNVNPAMVRDLGQVMARDKHRFGLFVMKGMPTKGMREEAASHGLIEVPVGGDPHNMPRYPALQFVTLAELFQGMKPKLPPLISPVKKAARVETRASHQEGAQKSLI